MRAFADREDDVDGLALGDVPFDLVEEADEFLMPPSRGLKQTTAGQGWRCMFCPMTDPSSTLSAAKSVVVPLRL